MIFNDVQWYSIIFYHFRWSWMMFNDFECCLVVVVVRAKFPVKERCSNELLEPRSAPRFPYPPLWKSLFCINQCIFKVWKMRFLTKTCDLKRKIFWKYIFFKKIVEFYVDSKMAKNGPKKCMLYMSSMVMHF